MTTPKQKISSQICRKSLNYKAQTLNRNLFETAEAKELLKFPNAERALDEPSTSGSGNSQETWMCAICEEDFVANMCMCIWVQDECVGLTKRNTEDFVCPSCV